MGFKRGSYRKNSFSREELVDFLKEHGIKSSYKLLKCRGEDDPNVYDYIKEFGSWSAARSLAFPEADTLARLVPDVTAEYLLQTIIQFKIETYDEFLEKRREHPDTFPSFHQVRKHWGSFSALKEAANRYSVKLIIQKYMSLKRRLGKTPSLKECQSNGIDLSRAVEMFEGSKRVLDSFVDDMEKV